MHKVFINIIIIDNISLMLYSKLNGLLHMVWCDEIENIFVKPV